MTGINGSVAHMFGRLQVARIYLSTYLKAWPGGYHTHNARVSEKFPRFDTLLRLPARRTPLSRPYLSCGSEVASMPHKVPDATLTRLSL
jgi:hypothetical protein